jgi:ABC-2 type transport system permease protein
MRNIFVIAERELKTYFISPIAYVVLTIFTFFSGAIFSFFLSNMVESATMRAMQAAQSGQLPEPMITMALFSEEKKRGTMELLLTAPITDAQVVLGKFLAASVFYILLLSTTLVHVAVLYIYSDPASGPIFAAYLGILLYGLAILAIGMFLSSLTENQIVAAIMSFSAVLLLWLIDVFSRSAQGATKAILSYLSIIEHLNDFLIGVISTSHIIFYLSLMLVGLFLTYRSLDSLRWRG